MASKKKARRKKQGFKKPSTGAFGNKKRKRASKGKSNYKGRKYIQRQAKRGRKLRGVERSNFFIQLGRELNRIWK